MMNQAVTPISHVQAENPTGNGKDKNHLRFEKGSYPCAAAFKNYGKQPRTNKITRIVSYKLKPFTRDGEKIIMVFFKTDLFIKALCHIRLHQPFRTFTSIPASLH